METIEERVFLTFLGAGMKEVGNRIKEYYIQNKWVQYVVRVGLIIGILMLVMPFVIGSGYTYLCEDDFSFEGGALGAAEKYGQIKGAVYAAHRYYMQAQGTYFANMVWNLVRPYVRWGMPGFHAVMIANMVVFILALCLTIKTICKDKNYSLCVIFLSFLTIWGMSDSYNLQELLFWYTGTVNFTWVLSFSMLTLVLQLKIREEKDKKKQWMLAGISVITALIGSGGALMITAVQCAWLLLVLLLTYDEIKEKKLILFPFVIAFIGALWNTCAPGNFVRVSNLKSEYAIWNAILDTWRHWKAYAVEIFRNPLFVLILATIFVITISVESKVISRGISNIRMSIIIVSVFATQYLTAFPAILGYQGDGLHNMRTSATYELVTKITFIFMIMCLAQWCRENVVIIHKILPIFVMVMVIFGLFNIQETKNSVKEGYVYNLTKELVNGTIRDVYKVREATLAQLDSASEGEDVVVIVNSIPPNRSMYGMGLMDYPDAFVNISAAGLFRLNSVVVIYKEE